MDREMVLQHARLGLESRRDSETMDDNDDSDNDDNDDDDDDDDRDSKLSTSQEARYNEDVLTETSKFLASLSSDQLEELSTAAEPSTSSLPPFSGGVATGDVSHGDKVSSGSHDDDEDSTMDIEQEIVATLNSLQAQSKAATTQQDEAGSVAKPSNDAADTISS
jgi:hypothetical protein